MVRAEAFENLSALAADRLGPDAGHAFVQQVGGDQGTRLDVGADADDHAGELVDAELPQHLGVGAVRPLAAPTYKGGFGFHPLLCFLANAGANPAADHIAVLDDALAQSQRRCHLAMLWDSVAGSGPDTPRSITGDPSHGRV